MDVKTIAKLADIVSQHSLTGLEVQEGDMIIRLSRNSCVTATAPQVTTPPAEPEFTKNPAPAKTANICAPMPGTFYISGAPEMPPFVKEGDTVCPNTVVCIVEAMKVMNQVKSEVAGTVSKILVTSGSPVEFGQPLFEIQLD